jgi:hypothetical protein
MWILSIEITSILLPLSITSTMALFAINDLCLTLVFPNAIQPRTKKGCSHNQMSQKARQATAKTA